MEGLINTFHIDVKLLVAQAINFAIVVFVLYKFAYKPLLKHMNERSNVIERGLEDAKKAQEELDKTEKVTQQRLLEAKQEARKILEKTQNQAEENREKVLAETRAESEKVLQRAKKQIAAEKEKMFKEVKEEVGQLVVQATEKVLSEKIDEDGDKELIKKAISNIK